MVEKPYKLAVRALIWNKHRYCLLLKRSITSKSNAGKWEFPGGKIDEGESLDKAMRREIAEETGLEVSFRRVVGAFEIELANFKVAQIVLEAYAESEDVRLSQEHSQCLWVKPQDFLNIDLSEYLLPFVKDYVKTMI